MQLPKFQQVSTLLAILLIAHYAAIENTEKNIYGIQFHPEVRHSVYGNDILT